MIHRLVRPMVLVLLPTAFVLACERPSPSSGAPTPSPSFRNVQTPTAYVGDSACVRCHAPEASAYERHGMAQSFHRWTPATRVEVPLEKPMFHTPTGFYYTVIDSAGGMYQVEYLIGPDGRRLHELRRRMDYVMGSGNVARTYFTDENGYLFQLPLTWYRDHGWDYSPGYQLSNARFDRLMPDRCIACHSSYPTPVPFLEGKYEVLRAGIGCERCHGPGALHVEERARGVPLDSAFDSTIVNPVHLPLERRLDVCEQCHVHTEVTVLREGKTAFSYLPSQPLRDQAAFFKTAGSIDIVSHADRLRQSPCFIATRATAAPLECATCHDPHRAPQGAADRSRPCLSCHPPGALEQQLVSSPALEDHAATSDCVRCHMPRVQERTVPHGTFTDHWIRVVTPESEHPRVETRGDMPIDPYYERDRSGPQAKVYQGMGEIVFGTLGSDAKALRDGAAMLDRALDHDTTRGDAWFLLGVAYQQLDQADSAIRALTRAVRIDSSRPPRLHALARAYESAGRSGDTIDQLYRRALAIQPALAWLRADYADFLQAQGNGAEAEAAYRQALAERPSLAVAWFNLGTLLTGQRRLSAASDAFRKAVELNPSYAEALSPLFLVKTVGEQVVAVQSMGSPLTSLPVRDRGPAAIKAVSADGTLRFLNVPPRTAMQILEPDGPVVRRFSSQEFPTVTWDLRDDRGTLVRGGLHQVRVEIHDSSGRTVSVRRFYLGLVRERVG